MNMSEMTDFVRSGEESGAEMNRVEEKEEEERGDKELVGDMGSVEAGLTMSETYFVLVNFPNLKFYCSELHMAVFVHRCKYTEAEAVTFLHENSDIDGSDDPEDMVTIFRALISGSQSWK
ncbi:unnamed protein product [Clavelina lepadiformis]|uniref:Uncharacterized protein n=1 Tax=Clavelina lepadiformis TaxID=159417 RepID=A0ABP0G3P9_CLALP